MLAAMASLFKRDLEALEHEVRQYPDDAALWRPYAPWPNPGGNLVLHVCGNLNHYVGARLGRTGYERNRLAEFDSKDLLREDLVARLRQTAETVSRVLLSLEESGLGDLYPEEVFGQPMSTEWFLLHLYGHLRYHAGQVNYHRRLAAASESSRTGCS